MEDYETRLNAPWETLDPWQLDYIGQPPEVSCFLLTGRQVGKTTAMSIKSVEMCMHQLKKGEYILIASITEKQGYHLLAKALSYAEAKYNKEIKKGKDKPTKHLINFKNGTGILSYPAGETGSGLRGFTIKKLMIDEGSRMNEEFFIAVLPQLSVVGGSIDIASTPCGKQGFFYQCSQEESFKKYYVSAEDCPRHTPEYLEKQRQMMSELHYSQEYLAVFTDELKRLFPDTLIKERCTLKYLDAKPTKKNYLGVDVGGLGEDITTYEVVSKHENDHITHVSHRTDKKKLTTQTAVKIIQHDVFYNLKKCGLDDGGLGFGVFSSLMEHERLKHKTIALNNASRTINADGTKSKKILKEEMYFRLLQLMEDGKITLLDNDEVKNSLSSIQFEENENKPGQTKIKGKDSHIVEGLIRAVWCATEDKSLNIFARRF